MHPQTPRDPIVELQQQVTALHRAVAGQRTMMIMLGLGLLAALTWNLIGGNHAPRAWAQDKEAMEVTCKALKVVDGKGKVRLQLAHNDAGGVIHLNNADGKPVAIVEGDKDGGLLSILGHDGKERAFVGVGDKQSGGLIYLKDTQGKNRASLLVYQDGHGGLAFRNADGKQEAFYGVSAKGQGGLINLNNPEGKNRVVIDCDKEGRGALEIINADDKSEIFMGSSAKGWGGLLNVNAPNGKASVILDVDENGKGRMNLRTKEEKRFVFAGADDEGGTIQVYGYDGQQRAFIGVGDKQSGGVFYLLNPDNNKARVTLGIDNNGIGYGEGRDSTGATRRAMR